LEILREQLEAGRIHFAPHLVEETKKSLMAVRYGADGEIDLETVDGRVRSMALAVTAMQGRDKGSPFDVIADVVVETVQRSSSCFMASLLRRGAKDATDGSG
jgi:hypothetical protein